MILIFVSCKLWNMRLLLTHYKYNNIYLDYKL